MAYMSEEGYKQLIEELKYLESVERPKIVSAIAEARDKGDLSENAEYDAAKEAQGLLEMKISQLKSTIGDAKLLILQNECRYSANFDESRIEECQDRNEDGLYYRSRKRSEFKIGQDFGKYSDSTGFVRKKVGDVAEITIPQGKISLEVVNISF